MSTCSGTGGVITTLLGHQNFISVDGVGGYPKGVSLELSVEVEGEVPFGGSILIDGGTLFLDSPPLNLRKCQKSTM